MKNDTTTVHRKLPGQKFMASIVGYWVLLLLIDPFWQEYFLYRQAFSYAYIELAIVFN